MGSNGPRAGRMINRRNIPVTAHKAVKLALNMNGETFEVDENGAGEFMSLFPSPLASKSHIHASPSEAWEYIAHVILGLDRD